MPGAEGRDRAIEANDDVKAGGHPGGLAERPQRVEMTVRGAPSVNHLWRDEEPAETPLNTAFEFARRFLYISPVDHCHRKQAFPISLTEIVDPIVVSPTVRVCEIKVVRGKRKNADGRKYDGFGDAPIVHSPQPGVSVEGILGIISSVGETSGEKRGLVRLGATETGNRALEHNLVADDEPFLAAYFGDPDRPIAITLFEVFLPQGGRLENVSIAVDHDP